MISQMSWTRRVFFAFRKGVVSALWLLAAGAVPHPAFAEFALLRPRQDSTLIESASGAFANGSGPAFFAGRVSSSSGSIRRALIAFEPAEAIPAGSRITAVTVTLRLHPSGTNAGPVTLGLHRVIAGWGEGVSSSSGGGGAPSQPGDSTWLHRSYPDLFWVSPGGDFDPVPHGNALVDQPDHYSWESTPEMVADIQSWLDDPPGNNGWMLMGDESRPTTVKRFDSREEPEENSRPVLTVEFVPPCEPDPRGAGYWERQCSSLSGGDDLDPGPSFGRAPTEPRFADWVVPCADRLLSELGLPELNACGALQAEQPESCPERAARKLSVLLMNICAGRLQTSCPVSVEGKGCVSPSLGELVREISLLIRNGDCRRASGCAGMPD